MRALITGAAGQDGTILSTLLRRQGDDVIALIRPGYGPGLLTQYVPDIQLVECELQDTDAVRQVVIDTAPDQVYNLGAFTAPGESWEHADEVQRTNVDAVAALLDALKVNAKAGKHGRLFQASSSHIFEGTDRSPQTEDFELTPHSPYAKSKAEALMLVRAAREDDGVFAVSGIMYNHESPLRTDNFVTRRITKAVARIAASQQDVLELGDIEVARDWGWAPDYVRAMMLMLAADIPSDFVLATGISHRLSFFLTKAFATVGIADWADLVVSTTDRTRLVDTNKMVGSSRRAYLELGWRHTVDFDSIATRMVEHDIRLLSDPDALWTDF